MKSFLSTFLLCLFCVWIFLMIVSAFPNSFFVSVVLSALLVAILVSVLGEQDRRLKTLEKRIQDLENPENHVEEKEK